MALTKTQINYLEDKLSRIVDEKIRKFRDSLGEQKHSREEILTGLKNGSIKLLPAEQIIKMFADTIKNRNYYYNTSFTLENFVNKKDKEKIDAEIQKREDKISDYSTRLYNAKRNALDKIVLEGVNIERAIKELDKVK